MKLGRRFNWRLESAEEYASELDFDFDSIKFDKGEDATVKKLTRYICMRKKYKPRKLRAEFPYIHPAYELDSKRDDPYSDVWSIEALVLAGVPDKEIAPYLIHNDPKFVKIFCLCFYDLRDKELKARYSKNIRALCQSPKNVEDWDYSWKYVAVCFGADALKNIVFERHNMSMEDMAVLDENQVKAQKWLTWTTINKRTVRPEAPTSESEIIIENKYIDIDAANRRSKTDNESGEMADELIELCSSVTEQLELTTPGSDADPNEKRLTKKEK